MAASDDVTKMAPPKDTLSTQGVFPALNSPQRVTSQPTPARQKVQLTPGHSLLDWIRLGNSGRDLTGVGGMKGVVYDDELANHNTERDAWTCVRGLVYNITPYLDFHPGGRDYLMKGAGIDATDLFNSYHQWVNAESMLGKCLIGKLKKRTVSQTTKKSTSTESLKNFSKMKEFVAPSAPSKPSPARPRYEWFQRDDSLMIVLYTRYSRLRSRHITVDYSADDLDLRITTRLSGTDYYVIRLRLEDKIQPGRYDIKISTKLGKAEIVLHKTETRKWPGVGKPLDHNGETFAFAKLLLREDLAYRVAKIEQIENLTHDVNLYKLSLPVGCKFPVPVGQHVYVYHEVENVDVQRPYTVVDRDLVSRNTETSVNTSVVDGSNQETSVKGDDNNDNQNKTDMDLEQGTSAQTGNQKPNNTSSDDINFTEIHLIIKLYSDGLFTSCLKNQMAVGSTLLISPSEGDFDIKFVKNRRHLVMYAAGSGITPMIRLINVTVTMTSFELVRLVFFNKTESDIVWREKFEKLADENEKFDFVNVLSQASSYWKGKKGRIDESIVQDTLPTTTSQSATSSEVTSQSVTSSEVTSSNHEDTVVCICGPSLFTELTVKLVKGAGIKSENIHSFLG